MRIRKTGDLPAIEMWDVPEIMNHLNCDEMKARRIFENYHAENGGYGAVEKALMLDYIERKQREEREREARYRSDLASVETVTVLKEHVKVLKEQVRTLQNQVAALKESSASSSRDARSAKHWAMFASVLSVLATLAASVIPWLVTRL